MQKFINLKLDKFRTGLFIVAFIVGCFSYYGQAQAISNPGAPNGYSITPTSFNQGTISTVTLSGEFVTQGVSHPCTAGSVIAGGVPGGFHQRHIDPVSNAFSYEIFDSGGASTGITGTLNLNSEFILLDAGQEVVCGSDVSFQMTIGRLDTSFRMFRYRLVR